jgi:inosine-uridine nucleoside N-ribohydrolase
MKLNHRWMIAALVCAMNLVSPAQEKRKIIIDQDGAGPGGTDQQAILLLVQSPETEVLGVTVVTGDAWLKEEVAHTLRTLEIVGRTDIPVLRGAELPLIRRKPDTELWEKRYGTFTWLGAWTPERYHSPDRLGEMPEGMPSTKAGEEDAPHFLIRMVHKYPHEVTIYEGGPMTNLALAISIDPEFAGLAKELVFMGGSLNPQTSDPEFANNPRHEFNLWFDPEAAHIVLRAPWKKVVCTTVDISLKTQLTAELLDRLRRSDTPAARYAGTYTKLRGFDYLWDELAALAWLDPGLITRKEIRYMDVNLDRGRGYGDTLTWSEKDKPETHTGTVEIEDDYDREKFYQMFVNLLITPRPH